MEINETEWLMRLTNILDDENLDHMKIEVEVLLDVLIYLHEALAHKQNALKDHELFLESIIVKFYLHGTTINNIAKGFKVRSQFLDEDMTSKTTFLDASSLLTVGRAQLETLLMYQHIYVNAQNEDETKLRYYSWVYTALLQRLDLHGVNNISPDKVTETLGEIAQFKEKIENCKAFENLSPKQQSGLLQKGTAKTFKTWDKIFKDSDFHKNGMVEKFYYLQSSYAHSEGLAAIQLRHNKYNYYSEGNNRWVYLQVLTSWFFTATMIDNLVTRFPSLRIDYLKVDERIRYEISFLIKVFKNK